MEHNVWCDVTQRHGGTSERKAACHVANISCIPSFFLRTALDSAALSSCRLLRPLLRKLTERQTKISAQSPRWWPGNKPCPSPLCKVESEGLEADFILEPPEPRHYVPPHPLVAVVDVGHSAKHSTRAGLALREGGRVGERVVGGWMGGVREGEGGRTEAGRGDRERGQHLTPRPFMASYRPSFAHARKPTSSPALLRHWSLLRCLWKALPSI